MFPFNYKHGAKCDRWHTFLNHVLEGDTERIALLQEFFGYVLQPGNSLHKFFLLEGQGANGKSVVLKTLESMLGRDNTSSVPLGLFGERFQLVPTIGKLVNIAPEADSSDKPHMGTLKAFTAGDTITIDRKGLTSVQVEPTAKLIVAANSRPTFVDRSEGLWRRLVVVPFRVTIPEKRQDRFLTDTLRTELPGIFNWALQGLKRLNKNKRFTESTIVTTALEEYKLESNPVKVFLNESGLQTDAAGEGTVTVSSLYEHYSEWSKANGHPPLSGANFGKELRKSFPNVTRGQKMFHGSRATVYLGVRYAQAPGDEADPEVIKKLMESAFPKVA